MWKYEARECSRNRNKNRSGDKNRSQEQNRNRNRNEELHEPEAPNVTFGFSSFRFLFFHSRVRFMALTGKGDQEQGYETGILRGARFLLTGVPNREMRRLRVLILIDQPPGHSSSSTLQPLPRREGRDGQTRSRGSAAHDVLGLSGPNPRVGEQMGFASY